MLAEVLPPKSTVPGGAATYADTRASDSVTASTLLGYLCIAWLAQLVLAIGITWWRRGAAPAPFSEVPAPSAVPAQPLALAGLARVPGRAPRVRGRRPARSARSISSPSTARRCRLQAGPVPDLLAACAERERRRARTLTRCYSLSDRPDPARYRVTIKRVPPPAGRPDLPPGASSSHFHDRVHEGDVLRVKAPSGHFFIDPDPAACRPC